MSLPIPGISYLWEMGSLTVRAFALHAYQGLRAGEGLNLRSATIAPGITALTTEVVIRTHSHLSALQSQGIFSLTRQEQRKQTELRLAAHGLVGAASISKATAQGLITKHPSAIRHLQLPTLILAGKTALQVVADVTTSHRASALEWDQLVTASALP